MRRKKVLDPKLDPWERQLRESDEAWTAFVFYRDMALPRRLGAVIAHVKKDKSLIERWSSEWHWVQRCRAWDRENDERARAALVREIAAARKRAADQARAMAQTLMLPAVALAKRLADPQAMDQLSKSDLMDLLHVAVKAGQAMPNILKAEALALGDVTDRPGEGNGAVDPMAEALRGNTEARALLAAAVEQLRPGSRPASGVRDARVEGEVV